MRLARLQFGVHHDLREAPTGVGERMTTEVAAQISGNLWKLEKAVGDTVEEEDVIMIIESMKMEIPVEAPRAGTIARIAVAEGDSIEEGMILAVIE
jgi:biotin carboxyl carrier protein